MVNDLLTQIDENYVKIEVLNDLINKEDNDIVSCAKSLKSYCSESSECNECIFFNYGECELNNPTSWDIDNHIPRVD